MVDVNNRVFLSYLKEIEHHYFYFKKSSRLLIEKWVEKLTLCPINPIWIKHRNSYIRLLLDMVLSGNLQNPFDTLPPEGPLHPFPNHLKPLLKDIRGRRESVFWRNIYTRFNNNNNDNDLNNTKINNNNNSHNNVNGSSRDRIISEQIIKEQMYRIDVLEKRLSMERSRAASSSNSSHVHTNTNANDSSYYAYGNGTLLRDLDRTTSPSHVHHSHSHHSDHTHHHSSKHHHHSNHHHSKHHHSEKENGKDSFQVNLGQGAGTGNDDDFLSFLDSFQVELNSMANFS